MSSDSEAKLAVFTDPAVGGYDHEALVIDLIDHTERGGSIHVCISHFSQTSIKEALYKAALEKDVKVHVAMTRLDQGAEDFAEALDKGDPTPDDKVEVVLIDGGFGEGKCHTKVLLFSKTTVNGVEGVEGVVVLGSFTLTYKGLDKQQNAVVLSSPALYRDLVVDWENRVKQPGMDRVLDLYSESARAKVYLFPRPHNVVTSILRNVRATRHPDSNARPLVRIAMARWNGTDAGRAVFAELVRLALKGCKIEVVARLDADTNDGDAGVSPTFAKGLLTLGKISFGRVKVRFGRVGGNQKDIHSKYMLISARYGEGADWEQLVFTGSPNFTKDGLVDGDEVMIKIRDKRIMADYTDNFERLWSYCA